jgi:hypothetical protein
MERLAALAFILILVMLVPAAFATSPLAASELTLKITQSGTISVQEPVAAASIVLAIPQNTQDQIIQRFSVKPDTVMSELVKDPYGNAMLKIRFSDLTTGVYNYSVETIVHSSRRLLPNLDIGSDNSWLAGNIPDSVREIAWNYREPTSMNDVAEIVKIAHSMLNYDPNSKLRTPEEILQSGSGDAMSYAILLTSLLRAASVPTRLVIGDAWLPAENRISNHAWVEILANGGGWVPFDAAFLRGGSIDSSYITKWSGESPNERLEFIGAGNVEWKQNPDRVDVLDSKTAPALEITAIEPQVTFPHNLYGWLGAVLEPKGCGFWHLNPVSCINESRQSLLTFRDSERTVWGCDSTFILWVFSIAGSNYICPVRIDEQSGAQTNVNVTINNGTEARTLSIEGLESVIAGEEFDLVPVGIDPDRLGDMILYSPTLDSFISNIRAWPLTLKPGTYDFYLWFDGSLATKRVRAVGQRTFSIAMSSPTSAAIDEQTPIRIDVTNLLSDSANAIVRLKVGNIAATFCWKEEDNTMCNNEYPLTLKPGEMQSLEFTTALAAPGTNTLTASIEGTSASFVSKQIEVLVPPLKQLERALRALSTMWGRFLHILAVIPSITLRI